MTVDAATPDGEAIWARAGLYDPEAQNADERLGLLRFLASHGVSLEEMVTAHAEDRLPFAAAEKLIRGGEQRLTLAELAERAGMPVDFVRRIWLADGFPDPGDEALFSEANAALLPLFDAARDLLGDTTILQVVRVSGWAMARIAEAEVAAVAETIAAPLLDEGRSELELAEAGVSVAQLLPVLDQWLALLHRHHVEAAVRRVAAVGGLGLRRGAAPLAVGFADLTGYTSLSERLAPTELGDVLAQFGELAADAVVGGGAQLVKLIGDAVMFVAADPVAACRVAIALVAAVEGRPQLPPLRVGLGFGDVLTREGDYFGPVVNRAARAVAVAAPGEVFADGGVRQRAEAGGLRFVPAGEHTLKGVSVPVELFRLERARAE